MTLHVRGRGLPDGEPVRVVDRRRHASSAEPVTTPKPSSVLMGLAAGSCPDSSTRTATSASVSTAPIEPRRVPSPRPRPSATSARCCCATRITDRHPQPRRSRRPAADHPGRAPPGAAQALLSAASRSNWTTNRQLPDAVAEQARRGDGWVKLVGDWIDREVGDLAPLWSDDVLKAAIDAAHARTAPASPRTCSARTRCPG